MSSLTESLIPVPTRSQFSIFIGWVYFFAWSISFYFQVLLNYSRQSVAGLSLDFLWLNFWGFFCYCIYNIAFYCSPLIRKQYREHWGTENVVQLNDVIFSVHATVITGFTIVQTFIYPRTLGPTFGSVNILNRGLSTWVKVFIFTATFAVFSLLADVYLGHAWLLDCVYSLSIVKMAVTLIKYTPQAIMNYQRKSTEGWSIFNILLDLTGGTLSMGQNILDSFEESGDWSGVIGNPVKSFLGFVSIFFDLVFIWQHYVLYNKKIADVRLVHSSDIEEEVNVDEQESQPLLGNSNITGNTSS